MAYVCSNIMHALVILRTLFSHNAHRLITGLQKHSVKQYNKQHVLTSTTNSQFEIFHKELTPS